MDAVKRKEQEAARATRPVDKGKVTGPLELSVRALARRKESRRRNEVLFRCMALIYLLAIGPCCYAQAVTIRVINANDGSPLRDQQVSVSLLYDRGEAQPAKYDGKLSFQTDAYREDHIVLPRPATTHISE